MSTMKKVNMGGHDFYYEHVPHCGKGGATVFAIKNNPDAKEFDLYCVVIPMGLSKWDEGCSSPSDGHVVCMCREDHDAKAVASAMNIATSMVNKRDELNKILSNKFKTLDDMYDTDAMGNEIKRLHSEGKSDAEIIQIMKDKRKSFLRKNPEVKKDGGEW